VNNKDRATAKNGTILEIVYPGKILKEYFMDPLEISVCKLAKDIEVQNVTISKILNNKSSISADMALRLSKYFGNSAEFWLNLRQYYELEKEREKAKPVLEKIIPFKRPRANEGTSALHPTLQGERAVRAMSN
jgi:addiction module HigA family antidote